MKFITLKYSAFKIRLLCVLPYAIITGKYSTKGEGK